MLIHRKGDIFIKLTKFLQYHSLAQLLVELMLIKIVSVNSSHSNFRDRYSSDIDDKFGSNNNNDDSDEERKN